MKNSKMLTSMTSVNNLHNRVTKSMLLKSHVLKSLLPKTAMLNLNYSAVHSHLVYGITMCGSYLSIFYKKT